MGPLLIKTREIKELIMAKDYVKAIEMKSIDTATIGAGAWSAINAGGTEGACFFIRITNDSNVDVSISYDGIKYHEYVRTGDSIEVNFQANASPGNFVSKLRKGTVLHARGGAGTGLVYVSGYYNG